MSRTWIGRRRLLRFVRSVVTLALIGVTAVASTALASPVWAPEDPWRLVAQIPVVRGPEARDMEKVARFLDEHGIHMHSHEQLTIAQAVTAESRRHGVDLDLLLSVILVESRFRSDAVSEKGAIGLMQLLPSTAAEVARQNHLEWEGDVRLLDPRTNIALGTFYLRKLMNDFDGDLSMALTAYNMGPNALLKRETEAAEGGEPTGQGSDYARQIVARARTVSSAL